MKYFPDYLSSVNLNIMKYILVILFSLTTFVGVPSFGADEADIKRLLETNECKDCDLTGADLKDSKLVKAKLQDALLDHANLRSRFS